MAKEPSRRMWRKAAKLLYQRRVHILAFGPHGCAAEVRGDTGTYEVTLFREEWTCNCKLKEFRPSWMCSHCAAVWMVNEAMKGCGEYE